MFGSSTKTPKLEASTKTTSSATQIQTTSSPSAQTSPSLKTHKSTTDSSKLPTTERSVDAPKTSPTRANLKKVRIPSTKKNSTKVVRTPPTKKNSANQDVRIPPTAPTVPLYHKLFPNKETPALSEEEDVINVEVKTDDNGVQGAVEESISTLEPILGCDKTNASNIRMDTEARKKDAKEKGGKSGESVEEDGFVLVLDRDEDPDGSPRNVQ